MHAFSYVRPNGNSLKQHIRQACCQSATLIGLLSEAAYRLVRLQVGHLPYSLEHIRETLLL